MPDNDLFLFVSHVSGGRAAAMEIVEAIEGSRAMLLVFSDRCND